MLLLSGCATYASLEHRKNTDPVVFGGTRTDLHALQQPSPHNAWLAKQALYIPLIDLPLSLMTDVILLPFTLSYAVLQK